MKDFGQYVAGAWLPIGIMLIICILILVFGLQAIGFSGNVSTSDEGVSAPATARPPVCVQVYLPESHRIMTYCS